MRISTKAHWYLSSQPNIHVCEEMEDAMRKTGIVVRGIFQIYHANPVANAQY